mmetsp:Transcript_26505/g.63239  ORF Transcript_26505/g.63239 Transcript_26505/m.63239 type:complete len:111 (-) Transcript_26505:77-409(-)
MTQAKVLLFLLAFSLADGDCTVGSRAECVNGVCAANKFFRNDSSFNECQCDFCYSGERLCDTNACLFWMLPLSIILCCLGCALCWRFFHGPLTVFDVKWIQVLPPRPPGR